MEKVDQAFLPPGVCFICEEAPSDTEVVDTFRTWDPGAPSKLDGRKYLCGSCIRGAGEQIGLISAEGAVKAESERDAAERRLTAFRNHVAELAKSVTPAALEEVAIKASVPVEKKAAMKPKVASGHTES